MSLSFAMRSSALFMIPLLVAQSLTAPGQDITSENNGRLRDGLRQFPEADANKDGILTLEEGRAFLAKSRKPAAKQSGKEGIAPTFADVAYGPHERNKLDFWKAKSGTLAPVVVFIHGGGFRAGDKSSWRNNALLPRLLERGVSCAAINYRFRDSAPIQDILHDAARAVQFIRSKAGEWNIDKSRIAAQGGSAGAGTSLWLATRDDLADPASGDPVLRESSRVCGCVLKATQATYDVTKWEGFLGPVNPEWVRDASAGPLFYGFKTEDDLKTDAGKKVLAECDMLGWISKDDSPILCTVSQPDGPPQNRGHWVHHPKHAQEIQKHCESCGVPCTIVQVDKPGSSDSAFNFLLKIVGKESANAQ